MEPSAPPSPAPAAAPEAPAQATPPSPTPAQQMEETVHLDETEKWVLEAFEPASEDFDDTVNYEMGAAPVAAAPPPTEVPVASAPPVQAAMPPIPAVPTQAAPAPVPGTTPQAPVAAAPQAAPPAAGVEPSQVSPTPAAQVDHFDGIAEGLAKQKEALVKALAENAYPLSDADLDTFNEDPRKLISKVAAQVQVETTASILKVLSQQLPVQLHGLMQARAKTDEAENQFWSANPGLDRTKHRDMAFDVMRAIRNTPAGKNMAPAEFIQRVGVMVGGLTGVNPGVRNGYASNGAAPQQVIQTPGPVVRAVNPGFVPAGPSTAPPSAHPAPQLSEWERLTQLFRDDEAGKFET